MGTPQPRCNASFKDFRCNNVGMQIAVIIIPILLTLSTLLVVVVVLWKSCLRRRGQKIEPIIVLNEDLNHEGKEQGVVNTAASFEDLQHNPEPFLEKWELPPDRGIKSVEFLCDGRFGAVCRATVGKKGASETGQMAIVRECAETSSPGKVREFHDLIKFHIRVCNHSSLVKVLWCQTTIQPLRLFLADMHPGNLLSYLWKLREGDLRGVDCTYDLTEKRVYSMALQLASGLEYLTGTLKLVHGYVAACNVLIDQDMNARLCGLGLAAEVYRMGALSYGKDAEVPIKWLAPERIVKRIITEKSDVWSFGIFLYEVVTLGSPPYLALTPPEVLPKLKSGHRMQKPEQCSKHLFEVMSSCWQWKSRKRPRFAELIEVLDSYRMHADDKKPVSATHTMDLSRYRLMAGLDLRRDGTSQVCTL
ncbi:tyrosine-protein kinase STYK1-like isoform X2 [Pleurodeles waltl]|uniref:tyrosine-protein kinase STYK1-like isoform X2 n=1 Tax=Pleurodeles waltl TaxID=8319 RepID=UPI003709BF24